MRKEILQLEKDAAEVNKTTMEEKADHIRTLNEIDRKKVSDLAQLEVTAARYRVRRELALTLKAEREAGIRTADVNTSVDFLDTL